MNEKEQVKIEKAGPGGLPSDCRQSSKCKGICYFSFVKKLCGQVLPVFKL